MGGELRQCWTLCEDSARASSGQCAPGASRRKGAEIVRRASTGFKQILNSGHRDGGVMRNMTEILNRGVRNPGINRSEVRRTLW